MNYICKTTQENTPNNLFNLSIFFKPSEDMLDQRLGKHALTSNIFN
jgi:hypothetical protein